MGLLVNGRVNGQGNWLWARQATGTALQETMSVATDISGNVYAAGYMEFGVGQTMVFDTTVLSDDGEQDIFLVKYNVSGNRQWAKHIGGGAVDIANCITTDFQGNVYLTGYFGSPTITFDSITLSSTGVYTMFLVKYDSNGNILWARNSTGIAAGNSVVTDNQGNVYLTGTYASTTISFGAFTLVGMGTSWDVFVVKYDTNGNPIWATSGVGSDNDIANSIAIDASSNVYITGKYSSYTLVFGASTLTNVGSGIEDIFIVKYDTNGNLVWAKSEGGSGFDAGNCISTDASGIYVTGQFSSPTISFGPYTFTTTSLADMFLVKYDTLGNVLWAKSVGGYSRGYAVVPDNLNNLYATGSFNSTILAGTDTLFFPVGGYDPMFIIKYNTNGNEICASVLPSGGDDICWVATDLAGNAYIAGDFYNVNPFIVGADTLYLSAQENFFVAKYSCNGNEGIAELTNQSITLYPNPTSTSFTITSIDKIESVKIYNVLGEVIWQNKYNNVTTATIDFTGNISSPSGRSGGAGIYFVEIKTENGIVRKKVVKE